jgi:hypothetical protein
MQQARPPAEVASTDEIRRDLKETRRKFQSLRQRYAELYIRSKEQQAAIQAYEARVAAVLSPTEDIASAAVRDKLLERLKQEEALRITLYQELEEFGRYLDSVLEALKPAEPVRKALDQRMQQLQQHAARQLSLEVERRGSGTYQCRIMDIEKDLDILVIDCGSAQGIRPGLTFTLSSADGTLAKVQVIDVRPAISAAIIISGRLSDLRPGMEVKLGE